MQESLHFGRFAIECGVVTPEQLNWALEQSMDCDRMVSDVLVEAGYLSVDELEQVLLAMSAGPAEQGSSEVETAARPAALAALAEPAPPTDEAASSSTETYAEPTRRTGPLEALGLADPAGSLRPSSPGAGLSEGVEPANDDTVLSAATTPSHPAPAVLHSSRARGGAAAVEQWSVFEVTDLEETHEMAAMPAPTELPAFEALLDPESEPLVEDARPEPVDVEPPPIELVAEPGGEGLEPGSANAAPSSRASELVFLLESAANQKASDLHLHAGQPPRMRIHGEFVPLPIAPLESEAIQALLETMLDEEQLAQLSEQGQVDFAHTLEGTARLRANAYRHRFGTDAVFRMVPLEPPTLAELGMPESLSRFGEYHQGMVLITGPSGCGKSSTLAALVDGINKKRSDHILTVEDPIEFVHLSRECNVNQRQTGKHTATFARALKAALREDPDVIAIGELRDLETIRLALTAAETGHLVLATMHTKDTIGTINRIIGSFPPEEQSQVRAMLSESLRAIVSQRLARKKDGSGRVPALEILVSTTAVGNLIREQKTFQLPSILQSGSSQGMCLMDSSLSRLLKEGVIDRAEALRLCENPSAIN